MLVRSSGVFLRSIATNSWADSSCPRNKSVGIFIFLKIVNGKLGLFWKFGFRYLIKKHPRALSLSGRSRRWEISQTKQILLCYISVVKFGQYSFMAVFNRIQDFVKSQGISVYRFQRDTKIGQRTAYDLYNNPGKIPSGAILDKICTFYGIQPGDIIYWERDPNNKNRSSTAHVA